MMRFSFRPFHRLQWQLSLSYTLVAAGALLVVELALIGVLLFVLNTNLLPNLLAQAFRDQFSANLSPFLEQDPPNVEAAARFLNVYSEQQSQSGPNYQLWTASEATENFMLLDPQGNLLWSAIPIANAEVGQPFNQSLVPGLQTISPNALNNVQATEELFVRTGDLLVICTPVLSRDETRVVGLMVMTMDMPSITNPNFIGQLIPTIGFSVLFFALAAGMVGSIFGFFTARRLTRRLARVSTAADAWSRGDFTNFIPDPEADELGELARRLNAMAEQLQNLMYTRQELAAVEERNRIARELHDSVKQQVFATAMQLGAARALLPENDASPVSQRLEEAERLTKQAQTELTALIRELRPLALEAKGLSRALREMTADWSRQTGIHARFECPQEAAHPIHLPLLTEQALFRVAQEALSNIARHSHAHNVRVCLTREHGQTREGGFTRLLIQDDGAGFDPTALSNGKGPGLGLRSMRERVEAVGGTFLVESTLGEGTRVEVKIGN